MQADGTAVESDEIPVGAVVTLSEVAPADVPNVAWGEAQFSTDTVTIGEGDPVAVTLTNEAIQGLGGFSVTKSLSGTGVERVPAGTDFTIAYAYPAGAGFEAGSGTLTVVAGDTETVTGLPAGAVVTLTEVRAIDPEGGAWGEPVFDHSTFTVLSDTTVAINLDNPIDLTTGQFSVLKQLAGNAADLVDGGAEFTVNYVFPAGAGYEAGSGALTVKADGTAVVSNPLPYGAVVTLTEAAPADVEGASWGDAKFSQTEVTIGDGSTVEVTLTNTITENPKTSSPETSSPETASPETPGVTPGLAITGGAGTGARGSGTAACTSP